jgi:hypothetical protein
VRTADHAVLDKFVKGVGNPDMFLQYPLRRIR